MMSSKPRESGTSYLRKARNRLLELHTRYSKEPIVTPRAQMAKLCLMMTLSQHLQLILHPRHRLPEALLWNFHASSSVGNDSEGVAWKNQGLNGEGEVPLPHKEPFQLALAGTRPQPSYSKSATQKSTSDSQIAGISSWKPPIPQHLL